MFPNHKGCHTIIKLSQVVKVFHKALSRRFCRGSGGFRNNGSLSTSPLSLLSWVNRLMSSPRHMPSAVLIEWVASQ